MISFPRAVPPLRNGVRVDSQGSGLFGARRFARLHVGTDYKGTAGEAVMCPTDCVAVRHAYPYADDNYLDGILLTNCGWEFVLFYLSPTVTFGTRCETGAPIGVLQDITRKYPGMTCHCHMEVRVPRWYTLPNALKEGVDWIRKTWGLRKGIYLKPDLLMNHEGSDL